MAQDPVHDPAYTTKTEQPGYGGNAEGVLKEQDHRPGMAQKMKHSLSNVRQKLSGGKGEHASHFPSSAYRDDPQMYVGHPKDIYGNSSPKSPFSRSPHSPHSPQSPHTPHTPHTPHPTTPPAVGHNPEFEPHGVGVQAADTVMPGVAGTPTPETMEHPAPQQQSRAEKFMEYLPGQRANPYTVHKDHGVGTKDEQHSDLGDQDKQHEVGETDSSGQHVAGSVPRGMGGNHVESPKKTGFMAKLKDMVTGQKPGQGTGTGHAAKDEGPTGVLGTAPGEHSESQLHQTTDHTPGNTGGAIHPQQHDHPSTTAGVTHPEHHLSDVNNPTEGNTGATGLHHEQTPGTQPYTQEPTAMSQGDHFETMKAKLKLGHYQHENPEAHQTWPSPSKPDYHNTPGAVHSDQHGKPVEGPKEEGKSPKKEGVMSKLMDKLHIGQQKPAHSSTPGTPTAATTPNTTAGATTESARTSVPPAGATATTTQPTE